MKRHLLLGMMVGTGAVIGIASLINQNPVTTPTAAPLMALAVGFLVAALWVVWRCVLALLRSETLSGWRIWRQAALWAITAGVLLYLQGIRSLSYVEAILICLAALLFELFFRSDKIDNRRIGSSF